MTSLSNEMVAPRQQKEKTSIFWGLALYQAIGMVGRGVFNTFIAIYLKTYIGLSIANSTLYVALPLITNGICQTLIWGRLSDRFHKRKSLIIAGEGLAGLIILLFYFWHAAKTDLIQAGYLIVIGLTMAEIFWSMANVGWAALISDLYGPKSRGTTISQITGISGVGRTIGIILSGFLYDGGGLYYNGWGFREGAIIYVMVGCLFCSVIPLLKVIPADNQVLRNKEFGPILAGEINNGTTVNNIIKTQKCEPATHPRHHPQINQFILFLIGLSLIAFGRGGFFVIFSQYLELETGFNCSNTTISQIFSIHSTTIIITGLASRKIVSKFSAGTLLIANSIIMIGFLLLISFTSSLLIIYGGIILWGITSVLLMVAAYTYASILIPRENRGRMFAWFNFTVTSISGLAGPFFSGFWIELFLAEGILEFRAYQMTFFLSAMVSMLGLLVIIVLEYMNCKKERDLAL